MSKKITIVRIDTTVTWNILKAKGGNWVAFCDPLKLTVQSETWANLMEDIALTLDAVLNELLSTNELERFLLEHRWNLIGAIPSRGNVKFDLPFVPVRVAENAYGSKAILHQQN